MADFEELLSKLRNPGDEGPGETIYDDLNAAYNDRVSAGDAKVAELSSAKESSDAEVARLKAHNYDLLQSVQQGNPSTVSGALESQEVIADADIVSIDDIISYG